MINFRIVDFPEPLAPMMILVAPLNTQRDTIENGFILVILPDVLHFKDRFDHRV